VIRNDASGVLVVRAPFESSGQISTLSPARPEFCGNSSALPASWMFFCATMSCFGSLFRKNLYTCTNDSGDVEDCTCVWFGMVTFAAPSMLRPGAPLPAHKASVRTPGFFAWPSMFT